jgi:hypothetical protein
MIIRYPSTAALADAYINHKVKMHDHGTIEWFGYETEAESLAMARSGNTKLVPKAERYLTSLDLAIETPRRVWERSPAGAFAVVPDVLAGLPTPMRRQTWTSDETQPITILVITTSSAAISATTLQRRGVVILALVMALTRIRPVSLHQLAILHGADTGETVFTSEINTHPLDLATACYVLTSAGFARRLTYGLAKKLNAFNGRWPKGFNYLNPEVYYKSLVLRLGLDPLKTLVVGAAQLGDELLKTPLPWIEKQIARFTSSTEETLYNAGA